ncbi:unnamed protein product, partial [Larinioides sclopetarius]
NNNNTVVCCAFTFSFCFKPPESAECSRGVLASGLYPNTCPCIDGLECKPTNEFYYKGLAIPTDYKCVN